MLSAQERTFYRGAAEELAAAAAAEEEEDSDGSPKRNKKLTKTTTKDRTKDRTKNRKAKSSSSSVCKFQSLDFYHTYYEIQDDDVPLSRKKSRTLKPKVSKSLIINTQTDTTTKDLEVGIL